MKSCVKCNVSISGSFEKCPLCQNTLISNGQVESDIFPFIPIVKYEHNMLYRILQLSSVFIAIVSLSINWKIPYNGFWSLFVIAGIACLWLGISIAVRKRHNIMKNMIYQVTIISILSLLWDIFTGWHGWSIDFVIPIVFASAMLSIPILGRILKIKTEDYLVYLILLILYGIIPTIFILCDLNSIVYPSLTCIAGSLFSLAALFIFEGANIAEELKRRMHL